MLRDLFSDRAFYRKFFSLTFPISLQCLMLALVAAADAFMLGRVDQDSMAAVSLATQIQFIQNMILWAIVSGVSILGAQYWGKRDLEAMGHIFGVSTRCSLVVSIAFFIGCQFFPTYLMRLFAHDANLVAIGAGYLKIASWSYLMTGVSQCYLAVMKVTEHAAMSAAICSGAVILNIIFNSVFIFGYFGIEALGANGAALATIIARGIELGWCIVASSRPSYIQLTPKCLFSRNRLLAADFLKCSLPILGAGLTWGIGFTTFTAIMGHLGPNAAAANSVAAVVRDILCCLCDGFSAAGGIIIGNELGAGNLERGRKYGDRIAVFAFINGLFATAVVLSSIPLVLRFMKLTPDARSYVVGMFVILSIYMIGRCVNTIVINGIFSAGGDTMFDFYSVCVTTWGIAIPVAFATAFWLDCHVFVVYACTCLDEVGKIPWVMHHYRKYKWVKNLTR